MARNTGKHTPATLQEWLAELTSWFDRHPKRNYRSVELPVKFGAALEASGLVTNGADSVAFLCNVHAAHLPERAWLQLFARRPDPVSGKGVPDLLLTGVAVPDPDLLSTGVVVRDRPAFPQNLDPDQMYEMLGANAWANYDRSSVPVFPV